MATVIKPQLARKWREVQLLKTTSGKHMIGQGRVIIKLTRLKNRLEYVLDIDI